ncbi:MAG: N-acetylneuraminate synthase [Deltaproteobacteria bacterium]|nr:N-acetylneuraminate synthase [Deltaproteobacteria bacterium]
MNSVYIIAEAGVNHNGDMELAKRLIDVAKEAGADAVKFQSFRAVHLASNKAPKADYQEKTTSKAESQLDMLKKLELSLEDHYTLIAHCEKQGIAFLSTPFELESLKLLTTDFDLPLIKVPSGEITNAPFLLAIARTQKPVILSTGMSTLKEVEDALAVLSFGFLNPQETPSLEKVRACFESSAAKKIIQDKVTVLHCTTEYPTPYEDVNLRAMDQIRDTFGVKVGLSDHTEGIAMAVAAAARGAEVLEKHFTLDKSMEGPDHKASLDPSELMALVKSVRQVEKALGQGIKAPASSEEKNIAIVRKSLVAAMPIKKGEAFTEENLTCKRPGTGVSPMQYWDYLGRVAENDYEVDEVIS